MNSALIALKLATNNRFDIYSLAGPRSAVTRAAIMSLLEGRKVPQAKAGVTALRDAFIKLSGVSGTCPAAVENSFIAWAKENS